MAKNYALEILEAEEVVLKWKLADIRIAICELTRDDPSSIIKIDNLQTQAEPVKSPASFHVTKVLANWLDKQPSPLSIDAFRETFPSYKEATLKTQLYNYKRNTGRS